MNTNLIRSKAIGDCFPGAIWNGFINYIKATLRNPENRFETTILHMYTNDFLEMCSNIDVLTNNVKNIANEWKSYGIKNIFFSGLTCNDL